MKFPSKAQLCLVISCGIGVISYGAVKYFPRHHQENTITDNHLVPSRVLPPFPVKNIKPDMTREAEEVKVSLDRRMWVMPLGFDLTAWRYFRVYHREMDQELIYWVGDLRWCNEEPAQKQSFYSYLTDEYCYNKGHNEAILNADMTCVNCIRPIRLK